MCIQRHKLVSFHSITKEAVDWSSPTAQEHLEAGVPAHNVFGSGNSTAMHKSSSWDLKGIEYRVSTDGSTSALASFYQGAGTADEGTQILGVIMSSHRTLGKGMVVELIDPPKTLFFICKVNVQCTDGTLEGCRSGSVWRWGVLLHS